MRIVPLTDQIEGINRMRSKGGASPGALYDLINMFVSPKGTINARPGLVNAFTLPANTVGAVGFSGKIHTFTWLSPAPAETVNYKVHVLRHPTGGVASITKIHRAFPFLGRPYVVAEFSDGVVKHYWLEDPPAWTNDTHVYLLNVVRPTTPNGYYYEVVGQIAGASPPVAWQPNTEKIVGPTSTVQPTVFNNFKYTAINTTGTAPVRTSNVEPIWPTVAGETVVERRYVSEAQVQPDPAAVPEPPTQPEPPDEYGPYPPRTPDRRIEP